MKIDTVLYLTVLSVKFHSGLQFAQLLGLRASLDMSTGDAVHDTSHKFAADDGVREECIRCRSFGDKSVAGIANEQVSGD